MTDPLNVVIPMAGLGKRLRPHTWTKPKALMSVAGKTCLDYILTTFGSVPEPKLVRYTFIVDPILGWQQIPPFIARNYPNLKANFIIQNVPKGQSDAVNLTYKSLEGSVLIVFSDTILTTNYAFLAHEKEDAVVWVKTTSDARNCGIVELNQDNYVSRILEKPNLSGGGLAVAGCYFFKNSELLFSAIREQVKRNLQFNGEYFLADAINILIERGAKVRVEVADAWLDTGTAESILSANRFLLESLYTAGSKNSGINIIPPVFIHESAEIHNSLIGPYVSIGANTKIIDSQVANSIIDEFVQIRSVELSNSIIGRLSQVQARSQRILGPFILDLGDDSKITL